MTDHQRTGECGCSKTTVSGQCIHPDCFCECHEKRLREVLRNAKAEPATPENDTERTGEQTVKKDHFDDRGRHTDVDAAIGDSQDYERQLTPRTALRVEQMAEHDDIRIWLNRLLQDVRFQPYDRWRLPKSTAEGIGDLEHLLLRISKELHRLRDATPSPSRVEQIEQAKDQKNTEPAKRRDEGPYDLSTGDKGFSGLRKAGVR